MLRGNLNPQKFTQLVHDIQANKEISVNDLRKEMGMTSEKELNRYMKELKKPQDVALGELQDVVEEKIADVSMVSTMVRAIVQKYGDAVSSGAICFVHKGEVMLAVDLDKGLGDVALAIGGKLADAQPDKETMKVLADKMLAQLSDDLDDLL